MDILFLTIKSYPTHTILTLKIYFNILNLKLKSHIYEIRFQPMFIYNNI